VKHSGFKVSDAFHSSTSLLRYRPWSKDCTLLSFIHLLMLRTFGCSVYSAASSGCRWTIGGWFVSPIHVPSTAARGRYLSTSMMMTMDRRGGTTSPCSWRSPLLIGSSMVTLPSLQELGSASTNLTPALPTTSQRTTPSHSDQGRVSRNIVFGNGQSIAGGVGTVGDARSAQGDPQTSYHDRRSMRLRSSRKHLQTHLQGQQGIHVCPGIAISNWYCHCSDDGVPRLAHGVSSRSRLVVQCQLCHGRRSRTQGFGNHVGSWFVDVELDGTSARDAVVLSIDISILAVAIGQPWDQTIHTKDQTVAGGTLGGTIPPIRYQHCHCLQQKLDDSFVLQELHVLRRYKNKTTGIR
jgi:hypothetical protein